jgi:hypothetical protein
MQKQLNHADSRPRVHIWRGSDGYAWSIGPLGMRTKCELFGKAAVEAYEAVGARPCVIIVEPGI